MRRLQKSFHKLHIFSFFFFVSNTSFDRPTPSAILSQKKKKKTEFKKRLAVVLVTQALAAALLLALRRQVYDRMTKSRSQHSALRSSTFFFARFFFLRFAKLLNTSKPSKQTFKPHELVFKACGEQRQGKVTI